MNPKTKIPAALTLDEFVAFLAAYVNSAGRMAQQREAQTGEPVRQPLRSWVAHLWQSLDAAFEPEAPPPPPPPTSGLVH